MASDNVEMVRTSMEAFARGDFERAFAAHDERTEWRTAEDEPDQRTYRGLDGLGQLVAALDELWDDRFAGIMEFEDFIGRGDWVVVPWRAQMRGRGSGVSVDVRETYAVLVRDGKIVRVDEHRHLADALAAVGAEP